ncbi:MAG: hypothetical protein MIO92_04430 [Methanosarcinaceae archaeon]|nr:hypothetical protein [Methanosarcinaceae archaeon]
MDVAQGTQNIDAGEPSSSVFAQSGDLVSTVELLPPKAPTPDPSKNDANIEGTPEQKIADANDEATKLLAGKDKAGSQDGGDIDLDKHPRFVQLNARMKEAEKRAASLEAQFNSQTKPPVKDDQGGPTFKDISKMTKDEILDWQTENPQEYYANILAQAKHEISGDIKSSFNKQSSENAVIDTYEQYAKENDDFDSMWDSGELQRFMDRHPGHTAISAHMTITSDKKTKAAIDEAVKKAEKKITDNIKAKRESRVLSSGPSASRTFNASDIPEDLKNTKEHGGLAAVLARRSLAREKAQYGS